MMSQITLPYGSEQTPPVCFGPHRRQRCSDFPVVASPQRVLFVGAERPDEFSDALELARQGNKVMVINPRATAAANDFSRAGGNFVRARIEDLTTACCQFDLICENYPYPSGRLYVPARPFALARLSQLALGGRWVLFTESARLASLVQAIVDCDTTFQRRFVASLKSLPTDVAPASTYVPVSSRYRVIFERRR